MGCRRRVAVALEPRHEPCALLGGEPARVGRPVGHQREHRAAKQHRRKSFDEEEPLPSRESEPSVEPQQRAADGAAEHAGQRDRDHEARRAPARVRREPLAQVIHDAREEPRLRDAEQKPQHVECVGVRTNTIAAAITPHVSMIRAIHHRAPTRARRRLLGTSNSA